MMKYTTIVSLLFICGLAGNNVMAEETGRTVNAGSTFLYGSLDGYLQTPAGGAAGEYESETAYI